MSRPSGRLVLVATPIGNLGDLSPRAIEALRAADVVACEDTRHSGQLLQHAGIDNGGRLVALHAHNEAEQSERLVTRMAGGATVACITDAGTPGISDPGERLVRAAVDAGIPVEAVPGPSAVITALVVSGMATERFCFEGFLPRKGSARTERLADLATERRTCVLYEAPHRVASTVADLRRACGNDRRICLARELTKRFEEVWRGTLAEADAHLAAVAPRGEYVLVLEGAAPPAAASDDDVDAALRAARASGLSTRDSVDRVTADLGLPRRRVYERAKTTTSSPARPEAPG